MFDFGFRSLLPRNFEALEGRARVLEGNAVQPPQRAVQRAVLQAAYVCWCRGDGWNGRCCVCQILSAKVCPVLRSNKY